MLNNLQHYLSGEIIAFSGALILNELSILETQLIDTKSLEKEIKAMYSERLKEKESFTPALDQNGFFCLNIRGSMGGWGFDYHRAAEEIRSLKYAKDCTGIFIKVDTPGGNVPGVQDLFNALYDSELPSLVYVQDKMLSAGMWAFSAADYIMASSAESTMVGSIGVVQVLRDYSEIDKKEGMKYYVLRNEAAQKKNMNNPYEKMNKDGLENAIKKLNRIAGAMMADITKGRRGKLNAGFDNFDGDYWTGAEALERGLIDEINTKGIEAAYEKLSEMYEAKNYNRVKFI